METGLKTKGLGCLGTGFAYNLNDLQNLPDSLVTEHVETQGMSPLKCQRKMSPL